MYHTTTAYPPSPGVLEVSHTQQIFFVSCPLTAAPGREDGVQVLVLTLKVLGCSKDPDFFLWCFIAGSFPIILFTAYFPLPQPAEQRSLCLIRTRDNSQLEASSLTFLHVVFFTRLPEQRGHSV